MGPKKATTSKSKPDDTKSAAKKGKDKAGTGSAIKVRHILCPKQSKALEAIERINNGEKFNVVAQELSDCSSGKKCGGDLGWQVRGQLVGPFQDAAFDLPKSTLASPIITQTPVKTVHGYHVIMVEDKK